MVVVVAVVLAGVLVPFSPVLVSVPSVPSGDALATPRPLTFSHSVGLPPLLSLVVARLPLTLTDVSCACPTLSKESRAMSKTVRIAASQVALPFPPVSSAVPVTSCARASSDRIEQNLPASRAAAFWGV